MGYTHYFKKAGLKRVSDEDWSQFECEVKRAIAKCEVPVAFEYDEAHKLPIVDGALIKFNGIGDDGHETFYLERNLSDFEFCKTANKPYDILVVAVLALAKDIFGDWFDVSSDGDSEDWEAGVKLASEVAGREIKNPIGDES